MTTGMAGGRRRAVIFGGSGFIGGHLVARLARDGWEVVIASRHPDRALPLKTMGVVGQIVPMAVDIRSEAQVAQAVAGADAVANLVGILAESGSRNFAAIHAEAPGRIGAAAAAAGVGRLVHLSALGADPESPSAYARSKAAGETALRAAFPQATILRPSIVFGPEDSFFNRFAGLARVLPALPLFGGGRTRFQPVYVGDVAAAAAAAMTSGRHRGETYALGGPRIYSFREIMELTLRETGRRRLLIPIPWSLANLQAAFWEWLPNPPLTRDQLRQLRIDNVVPPGAPGLDAFGIAPTPAEAVLPTYLSRFRRPGAR